MKPLSERSSWPDLRLAVHPLPWTWPIKPHFWHDDDMTTSCGFVWLFIQVEWWANRPMFRGMT